MIDCSHGNSSKNPANQSIVLDSVAQQLNAGNNSIIGIMLESNINEGNQPIPDDLSEIRHGVSVTDACINWETTETMLRKFASDIAGPLKSRSAWIRSSGQNEVSLVWNSCLDSWNSGLEAKAASCNRLFLALDIEPRSELLITRVSQLYRHATGQQRLFTQ